MIECAEHEPVWTETAMCFECARCGKVIESASGLCRNCGRPADDVTLPGYECRICGRHP